MTAMGKDVKSSGEPFASCKAVCQLLVILLGTGVLMASSYQFFLSQTSSNIIFSKNDENDLAMKASKEQCDLFTGEWIRDAGDPSYTNSSCALISSFQDCLTNGRPDAGFLHWRWRPHGRDLPRLDANKFLNHMKHKSLAFIGDSVFRNQMESLLCLLSKVEEGAMVHHDPKFQSKTWRFPSHNVTLGLIWAPFLVESTESRSKKNIQLYLDVLDSSWTSQYHKYDYIMFSGGQWFLKETVFWENGTVVGCHYCSGKNLKELGMDYSYRKALRSVFSFMSSSEHKPQLVILRTWSPTHFENGFWYNGGICNRTRPYEESEYSADPVDVTMRGVELEVFEEERLKSGLNLKLLDTYHLSALRPDGHPGPYRKFRPDLSKKPQEDCLHWCLPGAIDTWNDLFMEILMNEHQLKSAS